MKKQNCILKFLDVKTVTTVFVSFTIGIGSTYYYDRIKYVRIFNEVSIYTKSSDDLNKNINRLKNKVDVCNEKYQYLNYNIKLLNEKIRTIENVKKVINDYDDSNE